MWLAHFTWNRGDWTYRAPALSASKLAEAAFPHKTTTCFFSTNDKDIKVNYKPGWISCETFHDRLCQDSQVMSASHQTWRPFAFCQSLIFPIHFSDHPTNPEWDKRQLSLTSQIPLGGSIMNPSTFKFAIITLKIISGFVSCCSASTKFFTAPPLSSIPLSLLYTHNITEMQRNPSEMYFDLY